MGSLLIRRVVSVGLVLLLLWAGWVYLGLPSRRAPPARPAGHAVSSAGGAFHEGDRLEVRSAEPSQEGPCVVCHGRQAHWRDRARRALLNLHEGVLDCGACHLRGPGVVVCRFRQFEVVTNETLAAGVGGRLYAARRQGGEWARVLSPAGGVELIPQGPACSECHRRGSSFLAAEGLYDPYRRRVLEDLAVLRRFEGVAW